MGRPKRGTKTAQAKPDERVAIIHLKGTPEYAAWLDAVHRQTHIPKATLVRLALAEWAGTHGHATPPEL